MHSHGQCGHSQLAVFGQADPYGHSNLGLDINKTCETSLSRCSATSFPSSVYTTMSRISE